MIYEDMLLIPKYNSYTHYLQNNRLNILIIQQNIKKQQIKTKHGFNNFECTQKAVEYKHVITGN